MKKTVLNPAFYQHYSVEEVAQALLGKVLVTHKEGIYTSGMIVETEAYSGRHDKACHANNGKRTPRTEIMYAEGGHIYTYLIYGMHILFNVVTNMEGLADAVLIRAIEPLEGLEHMQVRRKLSHQQVGKGPGALCKALGIGKPDYGLYLEEASGIWIEDRGIKVPEQEVVKAPRVGVDYAGDDALLLRRYYLKNNMHVSKVIKNYS
ncbi:DNA-3-methyladenine glycosylase [Cytophagales bacterium LB-30]|uniref:Putative 3-methyladenine DNA glycosylase n=1 Tax=Shiella aurantiaca TaxID=3058365 RepID=A0ABT8F4Z8_9BACT|nr:DNA-3-methyladenine glycosylase [Shiella aurantiaca]MDN4165378.1 DNA-3-methyladenine glycosylase [Shiella aurantiaca]